MLAGVDNTYVVSALGGVGTGKSSLLNAITGEYTFETGDGTDVRETQQLQKKKKTKHPPPLFFYVYKG